MHMVLSSWKKRSNQSLRARVCVCLCVDLPVKSFLFQIVILCNFVVDCARVDCLFVL